MVKFLSVDSLIDFVNFKGMEEVFLGLSEYIKDDFLRWNEFEKIPRIASHSISGVIELMPISDHTLYSFKYVNGHPINTKVNLQTVTAFGVLSDVETGYPILLSEMTIATALRTAATSSLVAKHLLSYKENKMALIGSGSQAEFQILAFHHLLGVNEFYIWDIDSAALKKCKDNFKNAEFDVKIAKNALNAVAGADIVTTCTADKTNATVLTDEMLGSVNYINAIGGDCPGKTEIDPRILFKSKVFVELEEQTRIEGEIQQLPRDFKVYEIHDLFSEKSLDDSYIDQLTVFDSVGFALEDYSVLRYLYDNASEYFVEIDLITKPTNSKDIFALLNYGVGNG